jgi:O-acetyl-ADP-ribose deacetylase (regulator of RNase III)
MIKIITQDLLTMDTKYIAHQCNSLSNKASGIANAIFRKFPYSDIYSQRPYPYEPTGLDLPGNITVRGNGKDQRLIINCIAQWYPGKPNGFKDSQKQREVWFQECLNKIKAIKDLDSIAFPAFIGCGLAAGNWDHYYKMIEDFSENIDVIICKLK